MVSINQARRGAGGAWRALPEAKPARALSDLQAGKVLGRKPSSPGSSFSVGDVGHEVLEVERDVEV